MGASCTHQVDGPGHHHEPRLADLGASQTERLGDVGRDRPAEGRGHLVGIGDLVRGQRRSDEELVGGGLFEPAQHRSPALLLQRAEDQRHVPAALDLAKGRRVEHMGQRHGAVRVVGAIEQGQLLAIAVQEFVPRRPLRGFDAVGDGPRRDPELLPGRDGHRQVRSEHREARVGQRRAGNGLRVAERHQVSAHLRDPPLHHVAGVWVQLADHHGGALLDDPGLLRRDLGQRITELLDVIEGHSRDHRHAWRRDHVGGVQATAEPDLDHRDFDLSLLKSDKGGQRRDFEEGEFRRLVHDPLEHARQRLVVDERAVDLNALGEANEVRGGVEADALARRAGDGRDKGRDGALAVGPGDVHG